MLVIPLLLLVVLAMITFTQIIRANTVCLLASNQAARLGAVVYGNREINEADARRQVNASAEGVITNNLNGNDYTIEISSDATDVTVTVTFTMNSPVPWWRYITGTSTITARHTSSYRIEPQ